MTSHSTNANGAVADTVIDPALFRHVSAHWLSGVAVITARRADGTPVGLTMSAVTPLSLSPPLYLICLSEGSTTLGAIAETRRFCINILSETQEAICRRFASKSADKFEGLDLHGDGMGPPELAGALARLQCRATQMIEAGDHLLVIGEVAQAAVADGSPLGYFAGRAGPVHQDLVASRPLFRADTV